MKNECPKCSANLAWKLLRNSSMHPPIEIDSEKYNYSGKCPECGATLYINSHSTEKKFPSYWVPAFIWVVFVSVLGFVIEVKKHDWLFAAILSVSIVLILFVSYGYYKISKSIPPDWPRYISPDESFKNEDVIKRDLG